MGKVCESCAFTTTDHCPCNELDSSQLPVLGCYKYEQQSKQYNANRAPSSCGRCRFLFRKPKSEASDHSFIVCGATASMVQRIAPIPNCPFFKPIRKKQLQKRTNNKKGPYTPRGRFTSPLRGRQRNQ